MASSSSCPVQDVKWRHEFIATLLWQTLGSSSIVCCHGTTRRVRETRCVCRGLAILHAARPILSQFVICEGSQPGHEITISIIVVSVIQMPDCYCGQAGSSCAPGFQLNCTIAAMHRHRIVLFIEPRNWRTQYNVWFPCSDACRQRLYNKSLPPGFAVEGSLQTASRWCDWQILWRACLFVVRPCTPQTGISLF